MLTPDQKKYDTEICKAFSKGEHWGLSTQINLRGCNDRSISNKNMIETFAIQLCDLISMRRFGEPQVVYFGQEEKFSGYSLVQLIETSCITGHFAVGNDCSAYIDIFSCQAYSPHVVAEFSREFFGAKKFSIGVTLRR